MAWMNDPNAWIALITLTVMEIVLGIDNIIFISILSGKLPADRQRQARQLGLALAMLSRILLLFSLSWIMRLEADLFTLFHEGISGRDLILITGGLFLIYKSTREIHEKIDDIGHEASKVGAVAASFGNVLFQIMMLDMVFSLDSVITAVGMVDQLSVMVIAVVISVAFMMLFVTKVSNFVEQNPTVKILALSFLLLIGTTLVADGTGFHVPKGYIYFAMAFSVGVEYLNLRLRRKKTTST